MRLAREEGRAADERWHLRKDARRFWASGGLMPLIAGNGEHVGYIKILRDRSDQHEAAAAHQGDAEFLRGALAFMREGGQKVMEVSDFNAIPGMPLAGLPGAGRAQPCKGRP